MKTRNRIVMGLVATLPLVAAWPSQAQMPQSDRKYEHQHSRFDVQFPGGTLQEYVERIRQARPGGAANVVVMPNARPLEVPPVTLVAVTVDAAVQFLEGSYVLPDGREAEVEVTGYAIGDSPDLVMKVAAEYESLDICTSVWNVEEALMAGQSAEELLAAVEAVLSLFPERAKISFHPPTGLLIARGINEQLNLVREAIEELIESAEERRDRIESLHDRIASLEIELQHRAGEIKVAQQQFALAKIRHAKTMGLREDGLITPEEAAEAELWMTRAEADLDNHRLHHSGLQTKLESLREALKKLEQPRE